MKSIWYCSSLQQKKFLNNTRSQFSNNFDIDDLKSIDNGEIEVAIKIYILMMIILKKRAGIH